MLRLSKILTIYDTMTSDGAKQFLDGVSRNSQQSKKSYSIGLTHFQRFLNVSHDSKYTLRSIIEPLSRNQINVYELLNSFVSYLLTIKNENTQTNLSNNSIALYVAATRSYLAYYDIDVVAAKFKRKVKVPKIYREDEEPLDASDIRKILLSCNNRRLKPYLLILASGGLRATEACAIRLCDIDFSVNPTKIHVRKEYAKTKVARDIYVSDEATKFLKEWIDWKYRKRHSRSKTPIKNLTHLLFTIRTNMPVGVRTLYNKLTQEFNKILHVVELDQRKEGMQRRKITLHSFRRFAKTVISDQVGQDYSEWFLGHNKSPYYIKKEQGRRDIYATKCMKYLTYLDYTTLEATGKNIEAKISEKEKEIQLLRQRDQMKDQELRSMREQIQTIEQSQRQSFEEFKVENHRIIEEAMAKYKETLSPKALERFSRKSILEVLDE